MICGKVKVTPKRIAVGGSRPMILDYKSIKITESYVIVEDLYGSAMFVFSDIDSIEIGTEELRDIWPSGVNINKVVQNER